MILLPMKENLILNHVQKLNFRGKIGNPQNYPKCSGQKFNQFIVLILLCILGKRLFIGTLQTEKHGQLDYPA